MARADEIAKLKKLTTETSSKLIEQAYDDAVAEVLAQTRRTVLIDPLLKTARDMAVIALNRMGTEGESGRSEGGETYSFDDMPAHITRVINMYRLARVGGKVYEQKTTSDETNEG